ncbi:MAG: ABC transporter permease [Candidatus Saccharimonadales bacterium]
MSLVFAALSFLTFFIEGGLRSLKVFSQEGYGSSIYVAATPQVFIDYDNPKLTTIIKPQYDKIIADKKALAKKLGLTYDEKTDYTLPLMSVGMIGGSTELQPNSSSPITEAELAKQNSTIPGVNYTDFTKVAHKAGALNTYQSASSMIFYGGLDMPTIAALKDGKEAYTATAKQFTSQPTGLDSLAVQGATQMEDGLLKPFVLPGQSLEVGKDGSIPMVVPFSAAQEVLGLKKLPSTASADVKLARLTQVRSDIAGSTAQICYRNSASQNLLQQAIQQRDEIEANKNNKDYEKPKLLYALPATPCGATTTASDKRSDEEKKREQNQKTFDTTFGLAGEPEQGIVAVRIVGISSDLPEGASVGIASVFQAIFSSYTGVSWTVPTSAVTEGSLAAKAFGGTLESKMPGQVMFYAQFKDLASAKEFINQNDCFGGKGYGEGSPNKTTQSCIDSGKIYSILPYGNNAGAIEELQSGIWKVGRYVLLAILVIASVVMMGTLGKIIADSRRETAVFRALGAKRLDISQIYLTYALLMSGLIAIVSITAGALGAWYVNKLYSPSLSINAVLAYNARDTSTQFTTFGINTFYLGIIVALIVASALISAAIPLLTNMRRNPIRDMRDES